MKKLFLIVLIMILFKESKSQDLSHSVYIGWAMGTNVGGAIGIGAEYMILKDLSCSFAIGSVHPIIKGETDKSKFDFDIGFKFYPIKYLYLGLNYGLIGGEYSEYGYSDGSKSVYYKKTRGFSFTIGGRTPEYKKFYISAFLGFTSDKKSNYMGSEDFLGGPTFIPRMGILLGYCF